MSTLTKVLVVLVAVLSIALSMLFISAAAQWDNWRSIAQENLDQKNAALVEKQEVESVLTLGLTQKDAQLSAAREEVLKANQRVAEIERQSRELRAQLAASQNQSAAADASRKKMEELANISTGQVASMEKQNQTLLSENMDLQTRNQQLLSRVYELQSESTIREDEIRNMKERLAAREGGLGAGIDSPLGAERYAGAAAPTPEGTATLSAVQTTPAIRGEVIDVAGNYASINLGESSGIGRGMVAMIFRGTQYLADLTIDTVQPREAGGKLTNLVGGVRAGDRVQIIRR